MPLVFVPGHVNETTGPVDNLGGVLSVMTVGALILAINFAPVPGRTWVAIGLGGVAVLVGLAFFLRQRRAAVPLYDLRVAGRRIFWVAACAGMVVFGTLMGAMFIGQQFLQNVLSYSTFESGLAILPAAVLMLVVAPRSARLVEVHGARFTLLLGYAACLLGFVTMLLLWKDGSSYLPIGLAYGLIGIGVGLAGTPASHSLTGAVPVTRAGMASGTADLQRDLGGAVMQSVLGALLTAGYASAVSAAVAGSPDRAEVTDGVAAQLTRSFASASAVAERYPQYASEIIAGAKGSFVDGADWAYLAGIVAILAGATLVWLAFPSKARERELLDRYQREDTQPKGGGGLPDITRPG
jgi:MFS transporter, DHA2 family, multidrug resistance protein